MMIGIPSSPSIIDTWPRLSQPLVACNEGNQVSSTLLMAQYWQRLYTASPARLLVTTIGIIHPSQHCRWYRTRPPPSITYSHSGKFPPTITQCWWWWASPTFPSIVDDTIHDHHPAPSCVPAAVSFLLSITQYWWWWASPTFPSIVDDTAHDVHHPVPCVPAVVSFPLPSTQYWWWWASFAFTSVDGDKGLSLQVCIPITPCVTPVPTCAHSNGRWGSMHRD